MKSRYYKIKNKEGLYWTGYSSNFSKGGKEFASLESVGFEVNCQRYRCNHISINRWLNDAEIVEFVTEVKPTNTYNLEGAVKLAKLSSEIRKEHGREFHSGFYKIVKDPEMVNTIKFAVRINPLTYKDLRVTLKELGYSSRHYRKTGSWIWFGDDEIAMRIKLLDGDLEHVKLEKYITDFKEANVTLPDDLDQEQEEE